LVVQDDGELIDILIISTLKTLHNYLIALHYDSDTIDLSLFIAMIWEEEIYASYLEIIANRTSLIST
jgi:hypothetical protein